jgi:hypothetical protein
MPLTNGKFKIWILLRGDRGAVWFSFEHKSHPNRKIKMHAVRFGSVGF